MYSTPVNDNADIFMVTVENDTERKKKQQHNMKTWKQTGRRIRTAWTILKYWMADTRVINRKPIFNRLYGLPTLLLSVFPFHSRGPASIKVGNLITPSHDVFSGIPFLSSTMRYSTHPLHFIVLTDLWWMRKDSWAQLLVSLFSSVKPSGCFYKLVGY